MDKPTCFGKKHKYLLFVVVLFSITPILAKSKPSLIDVKIGLTESLSPTAPSSSDRYKRLYESALFYAIGENEKKLQACGYKITSSIYYFDTFDAKDLINATKKLEESNAWVIIGPRRSSQFITASKSLKSTPIISTMANADKIYNLNKLSFSMYPSGSSLAKLMANEIEKKKYGENYGTIVDVRCDTCIDFVKSFHKANASNESFYLEVADNTPDLTKLREYLSKHQVDYLLIPNYSELSGYIISEIQKLYPNIKYVGADGWGEDTFSFLQGYGINKNTVGISIRAGAQKNDKCNQYKVYSLDTEINGSIVTPPQSIYSLVELIRTLSDDLCKAKPKNRDDFSKYLSKQPSTHFQKETFNSFYSFNDGQLAFSHYLDNK
ncbi:MAG: hypothetical protein HYX61_06595 [Gammaproteobacteria bacterium]|jgi:hypothetical protein|nr:hypothetical protein [Gammaproteobacteria bacterium]